MLHSKYVFFKKNVKPYCHMGRVTDIQESLRAAKLWEVLGFTICVTVYVRNWFKLGWIYIP